MLAVSPWLDHPPVARELAPSPQSQSGRKLATTRPGSHAGCEPWRDHPPVARELAPARLRSSRKTAEPGSPDESHRLGQGPLRSPAGASSLATIRIREKIGHYRSGTHAGWEPWRDHPPVARELAPSPQSESGRKLATTRPGTHAGSKPLRDHPPVARELAPARLRSSRKSAEPDRPDENASTGPGAAAQPSRSKLPCHNQSQGENWPLPALGRMLALSPGVIILLWRGSLLPLGCAAVVNP